MILLILLLEKLFFTEIRDFYCVIATALVKIFLFKDSLADDVAFLFQDK